MTHRERVLAALSRKPADRVAFDFWAVPETLEKLYKHFGVSSEEEVLQKLDIDVRLVAPDYIGPEMKTFPDGSFMEPMGTHRRNVTNEVCTYQEYASSPMGNFASAEEVYAYPFADVNWWDFAGFSNKIGSLNKEYYVKVQLGGLFELAWALRGYEQFLMDMIDEPEIAYAIIDRIASFYCEFVHKTMETCKDKIDMFYTYDDIAAQNSLLMSPGLWEEFIAPHHRRLNAVIKSYGKTIMYHSCGAIYPMIQKLIDLPIDVLNPLQPKAKDMDFAKINAEFGDKVCFHGGICIQETLPNGTPEDVAKEVRHALSTVGKGGGYILASAHYIQADTPVENIIAMYEAGKKGV